MRGSYPDAWFLSRRTGGGLTPPIDRLLTPPRALSASAQYTDNLSACTGHAHDRPRSRPSTPLSCAAGRKPCSAHPTTPRTPHTSRAPRTTAPDTHPPPAHTKRARTNRSGRATYSAQALGRLPWFAPCLRRSRRLRPLFDIVVSSKTEISNLYSFSHPQRFSKQRAPCESKLTILSSSSSPSRRSWRQSVLEETQVRVRRGSVPVASEYNARCTSIPGSGNSAKCVRATARAKRDPSGSQS